MSVSLFQDKADEEEEEDESKDKKRRTNHTVLERQRRCEQRVLFDKLSAIMKCDPRVPRLRLLSMVSSLSSLSLIFLQQKQFEQEIVFVCRTLSQVFNGF